MSDLVLPRTVRPAPDRRVRRPDGVLLDPAGEEIAWSSYWQRRLDDGDVIESPAKKGAR